MLILMGSYEQKLKPLRLTSTILQYVIFGS